MEIIIKINGQNVSVNVSTEVFEYLDQADHKQENLSHEKRRHWDSREFDDYIILNEGYHPYYQTPEDIFCQKETLTELVSVLESCTAKQKERFLLYALDDLGYTEIGRRCGCSKVSAYESIVAVRKKFKKYFADMPNNSNF